MPQWVKEPMKYGQRKHISIVSNREDDALTVLIAERRKKNQTKWAWILASIYIVLILIALVVFGCEYRWFGI